MKLEKLLDKKGRFTELVRITDYTSIQECIDIINNFYEEDEYPWYVDKDLDTLGTEKTFTYVYLTGDGRLDFVENLNEFDEGYKSEQEWGVVHSIPMN